DNQRGCICEVGVRNQGLLRAIGDASLLVARIKILHDQFVIDEHIESTVAALFTKHKLQLVQGADGKFLQCQLYSSWGSAPANAAGGLRKVLVVLRVPVIDDVPIRNSVLGDESRTRNIDVVQPRSEERRVAQE